MTWYVDRTRYEAGHTCPWRRLLGFHAQYTGLSPKVPGFEVTQGILIHEALECFLKTGTLQIPKVSDYAGVKGNWGEDTIQRAQAAVDACTHGWIRTVWPLINQQFDIVGVEQEMKLELPSEDQHITWMLRPDLILRSKQTKRLSCHDFKSVGSWRPDYMDQWADSLQMMMNAYGASQHYGEPVDSYYIHFLVRGTRSWPTSLTDAYYKPANPPLEPESWLLKKPYGRAGDQFEKVLVSSKIPTAQWIQSLPPDIMNKYFIFAGPFMVNPYKVRLFIEGLLANEWWWRESLGTAASSALNEMGKDWGALDDPKFKLIYSRYFPRTFNCYTYNTRCSYYDLCLKPETKWQEKYELRKPHHPTEEIL